METTEVCSSCGKPMEAGAAGVCAACQAQASAPAAAAGPTMAYGVGPSGVGEGKMRPFLPRIVNFALGKAQGTLSVRTFESVTGMILLAGEFATYAAVVLLFIAYMFRAFKTDSLTGALVGAGICAGVVLALYVSLELIVAGLRMLRSSPTRLTSAAYLNCLAVILLVTALACFCMPFTAISSLHGSELFATFAIYWAAIIPSLFGAILALNPAVLNIEVTPAAGAGETFIGLVSFLLKAWLAMLSLELFLGAMLAIVLSLTGLGYWIFSSNAFEGQMYGSAAIAAATLQMGWAVLNPIATILVFLLFYLAVDLCQAVLTIPKLKRNDA